MDQSNQGADLALQRYLKEIGRGMKQGFEISGEDRRDALMDIREQRSRAEPTRVSMMFNQHPVVDAMRQFKTIYGRNPTDNPNHKGWQGALADAIPVAPFDDAAFAFRNNAGLNIGDRGSMSVLPKDDGRLTPEEYKLRKARAEREIAEQMPKYKSYLASIPKTTQFGHALGSLAQDLATNSTRSAWWLINAVQATTDVISEAAISSANPDLYGYEPILDLPKAELDGLVRFSATNDDLLKAGRDFDVNKQLDSRVEEFKSFLQPELDAGNISKDDFDSYLKEKRIIEEQAIKQGDYLADADDYGGYGLTDTELRDDQMRKGKEALKNDARYYTRNKPGVKKIGARFKRRSYSPNLVNVASMLPAAIGINAGLGLLNRPEGYQAVLPSEDDPRKNSNIITSAGELGSKYFLGRNGRMMEQEDFLLERPDVTAGEYQKYKGYLRDRSIDLNPFDDGKVNLGGVLKNNPDGIHGSEISFLGKTVSTNEALIPTIAAGLGTAAGALLPNIRRLRFKRGNKALPTTASAVKDGKSISYNRFTDPKATRINKIMGYTPEIIERNGATGGRRNNDIWDKSSNPLIKGANPILQKVENFFEDPSKVGPDAVNKTRVVSSPLLLGTAGLAAGMSAGGALEDERRRRNFAENNPGVDYDIYKERAGKILNNKIKLAQNNPNSSEERSKSGVGFNKRGYQQSLLDGALENQAQIDSIVNEEKKARANQLQGEGMQGIAKADLRIRQMDLMADDSKLTSYDAAKQSYADAIEEVGQKYLEGERKRQERKERDEAVPLY